MDIESSFSSLEERNKFIVSEKNKGTKNSEIATIVGLCDRQVRNIYRMVKLTRHYGRKHGSGHPESLSKNDKIRIRKEVSENPYLSCSSIKASLGLNVERRTIANYLRRAGLTYKKGVYVPNLTLEHKNQRLMWAIEHKKYKWSQVIFTDETTLQLNQARYGWSKKGHRIAQKTDCYNPRVQIWGAISRFGLVHFSFYEGSMDSHLYIKLMEDEFLQKANTLFPDGWILQQDGAKAHTAKRTLEFFKNHGVEVLEWPSKSADLNPIENIWPVLKQAVYSRNPQDIDELKAYVKEEIDNFSVDIVQKLVNSMSNRVKMVIENKGDIIDY